LHSSRRMALSTTNGTSGTESFAPLGLCGVERPESHGSRRGLKSFGPAGLVLRPSGAVRRRTTRIPRLAPGLKSFGPAGLVLRPSGAVRRRTTRIPQLTPWAKIFRPCGPCPSAFWGCAASNDPNPTACAGAKIFRPCGTCFSPLRGCAASNHSESHGSRRGLKSFGPAGLVLRPSGAVRRRTTRIPWLTPWAKTFGSAGLVFRPSGAVRRRTPRIPRLAPGLKSFGPAGLVFRPSGPLGGSLVALNFHTSSRPREIPPSAGGHVCSTPVLNSFTSGFSAAALRAQIRASRVSAGSIRASTHSRAAA
jgi:hypothetical protein